MAALSGGVNIVEHGHATRAQAPRVLRTLLPAFRKQFPEVVLLRPDMKNHLADGGGGEARSVYAGGMATSFLTSSLSAGVDTAKAICAVRDEFQARAGSGIAATCLSRHHGVLRTEGPAKLEAVEVATSRSMIEAGVDGLVSTCSPTRGVQTRNWLSRTTTSAIPCARAVFERIGKVAAVRCCRWPPASHRQRASPKAGLRAFVISGKYMGLPDGNARLQYLLRPRSNTLVAGFHRRGFRAPSNRSIQSGDAVNWIDSQSGTFPISAVRWSACPVGSTPIRRMVRDTYAPTPLHG